MDGKHLRVGMGVLAVVTAFALFGQNPALAMDLNRPRAEGAGWFNNFSGEEVKFGITLTFDNTGMPQGRFEYFNTANGLTARGKFTQTSGSTPNGNSCTPFGPIVSSLPSATLTGDCDDGTINCFSMEVVDGGKGTDGVCHVNVKSDNDTATHLLFRG